MADSSSDRVAELKRKMQETAAKRMAEQAEKENASLEAAGIAPAATAPAPTAPAATAPAATAPAATAPAATAPAATAPAATAPAEAVAEAKETAPAATDGNADEVARTHQAAEAAGVGATGLSANERAALAAAAEVRPVNIGEQTGEGLRETLGAPVPTAGAPVPTAGASLNGATAAPGDPELPRELTPEELEKREMTRRELLTYAWGGALALVGGAVGVGLFGFMYPRFRAGEFGGAFFISSAELPASDAAPVAFSAGKFWLVETEEGDPRALYMVCTHLGCLYKWEESNFRFECPCHGSKFSKDGYYIEGPAPRSLDLFATTLEGDTITVDTGSKTIGAPAADSPARAGA